MRLKAGVTGLRAKRLEYIELQIRGEVLFEKDATMAVVAEGATIGVRTGWQSLVRRKRKLWRSFTQRFSLQALSERPPQSAETFMMSEPAMVPLG